VNASQPCDQKCRPVRVTYSGGCTADTCSCCVERYRALYGIPDYWIVTLLRSQHDGREIGVPS
jgi:hypothetical protein